QFTATADADGLQVAIKGVEVQPFERGGHGTCLPPLVSRQEVPYVLGAVDRRDVQVPFARRQQPGDARIVDVDAENFLGAHDGVHQPVDHAAVGEYGDGFLMVTGGGQVPDPRVDPREEPRLVDAAWQVSLRQSRQLLG